MIYDSLPLPLPLPLPLRQTSIDKLLTSSASTQHLKVLPILGADLTSEEKDLLPYWSGFVEAMSNVLWLPTKTDCAVSGLTSSSGSASITGVNSWFSTRSFFHQTERWWRIYLQLSTYSVAACTDSENTSSKSKKTKKYKRSSRHQSEKPKPNVSHKIRVYPDNEQRQVWWNWMSACRVVYNLAIAELQLRD